MDNVFGCFNHFPWLSAALWVFVVDSNEGELDRE